MGTRNTQNSFLALATVAALAVGWAILQTAKIHSTKEDLEALRAQNQQNQETIERIERDLKEARLRASDDSMGQEPPETTSSLSVEPAGSSDIDAKVAALKAKLITAFEEEDGKAFVQSFPELLAMGEPAYGALEELFLALKEDKEAFEKLYKGEEMAFFGLISNPHMARFALHEILKGNASPLSDGSETEARTIQWISQLLKEEAKEPMHTLLATSEEAGAVEGAIRALHDYYKDPSTLAQVEARLSGGDLTPEMKYGILQEIAFFQEPEARRILEGYTGPGADPEVLVKTLAFLLPMAMQDDIPRVRQALNSVDPALRAEAFDYLNAWSSLQANDVGSMGTSSQMGGNYKTITVEGKEFLAQGEAEDTYRLFEQPQIQQLVLGAARNDGNQEVRLNALKTARLFPEELNTPVLVGALQDTALPVRQHAFEELRHNQAESVTEAIRIQSETENDEALKAGLQKNLKWRLARAKKKTPAAPLDEH